MTHDESSETVDVSSSGNSASYDSESEEENLASQKTSSDDVAKRNAPIDSEDLTTSKEKHSEQSFFTLRGLLNRNMILFAGRSRSKNRSVLERVDSRN